MPQSKKIANPEYVELVKSLARAKADHKKKGTRLDTLNAKLSAIERSIIKMNAEIEKSTALAAQLSSDADDAISAFQDARSVITEIELQIKMTPKQIAQD